GEGQAGSRFHALVHGALGGRQDHHRRDRRARAKAQDRQRGGSRRGHRQDEPLQGPRLLAGGPRHERPPHRLRGEPSDAQRRRGDRLGHLSVQGGPGPGAPPDRRGLYRDLRGRPGRGVRRARREGPVQEGILGGDPSVHRRLRPLRGPGGSRASHQDQRGGAPRERGARGRAAGGEGLPRAGRATQQGM
ncbi:MAG: Adenylylsulfate kinase, partial [uncultured Rubrobacteraceae bacterium]